MGEDSPLNQSWENSYEANHKSKDFLAKNWRGIQAPSYPNTDLDNINIPSKMVNI